MALDRIVDEADVADRCLVDDGVDLGDVMAAAVAQPHRTGARGLCQGSGGNGGGGIAEGGIGRKAVHCRAQGRTVAVIQNGRQNGPFERSRISIP